jgi:Fe-S-cluster-containing hydrogenase component 2
MSNGFLSFFKNNQTSTNEKATADMTLAVKINRCPQNHPCPSVKVCPVGALSQQGFKAPVVDMAKCIKCGKCVKFCPMRALVFE